MFPAHSPRACQPHRSAPGPYGLLPFCKRHHAPHSNMQEILQCLLYEGGNLNSSRLEIWEQH